MRASLICGRGWPQASTDYGEQYEADADEHSYYQDDVNEEEWDP